MTNHNADADTGLKTGELIGRESDLAKIREVLFTDEKDYSFKLLLLAAEGGLGKTRLLEDALGLAGHPTYDRLKENAGGPTLASGLIDVIDIRLHDSYRFVDEIRRSFRVYDPPVIFPTYDNKNRVGREAAAGAFLESMSKAKQTAIAAFEQDLRAISRNKRVAIFVDTVERLESLTLEKLFDPKPDDDPKPNDKLRPRLRGLLDPEKDLGEHTYQWLLKWIEKCRQDKDANITLVLAGRPDSALFKELAELEPVTLKPLDVAGVGEYFRRSAIERLRRADYSEADATREVLAGEAADPDKYKLLYLYTGGSPIRLALYDTLVTEGKQMPAQLQLSYAQALADAGLDAETVESGALPDDNTELEVIRWKVEEAFIDLLFQGVDRRSRVMLALIRSPRGLTAEQLHFLLDSKEKESAANWPRKEDERERELELDLLVRTLREIEDSPLGKRRSDWSDLAEVWPRASATYRVGLQDEIYTIFSNHTGLWSDFPATPDKKADKIKAIRAQLSEEEEKYKQLFRDEQEARERQYKKLADWAQHWGEHFRRQKRDYLAEDEAALEERLRLDNPHTFRFPFLGEEKTRRRAAINAAITICEIERLVYRLLLKVEEGIGFNNMTLEDNHDLASRREDDFWAQSEVRQTLDDENLMRFVKLPPTGVTVRTGKSDDTRYHVIHRVARQQEAVRWIKRFVFTGQYGRAVDLADKLNGLVSRLERETTEGKNLFHSWNHTLARGERTIWREYARILQGNPDGNALTKIEQTIDELGKLYDAPYTRIVREKGDQPYDEYGFANAPDDPNGDAGEHPGRPRLGWILSHAHNNLGYGYRQGGQYLQAVEHHGRALDIIRPSTFKEMSKDHLARVLNNLARALMEMGKRSEVVALDALHLRRELAEEVSLAASFNTLARIYDRAGRHEDAARLSAKAIALCERAGESHQLDLSLLQMASALRHRSYVVRHGRQSAADPDTYLTAAEEMLFQADELLRGSDETDNVGPGNDQLVGLIQIQLERGRLLRDRLRHERPAGDESPDERLGRRMRAVYLEARETLQWVEKQIDGRSLDLPHILLNIQTNQARVYYYYYLLLSRNNGRGAGDSAPSLEELLDNVKGILADIGKNETYREHRDFLLRSAEPDDEAHRQLLDKAWIFRQLSTAEKLSGRLALDQYEALPTKERNTLPAADYLHRAFTHYARGIHYAELFAPQGRSVVALQADLYEHLNRSNQNELRFQRQQLEAEKEANEANPRMAALLERIDTFFKQFFGLWPPPSGDESPPDAS